MTKNKGIWIINGILITLLLLVVLFILLGGWETTITLNGEASIQMEYGSDLEDPGAKAQFHGRFLLRSGIPVPVASDADEVTFDSLGTYSITYAAGIPGASATATRTVEVVDTTPPEISLVSNPDSYTRPGDTYQEEGFSATDLYDGDLTQQVERTETETSVTYTVSDTNGNTASVTREIIYDDREAPVITLSGETDLVLEKGTAYEEPGYTALDDCDGDITSWISAEQLEDGIRYTVEDSYGNEASVIRKISYVDTLPPELTLTEGGEIWMKAGQPFTEPGFTAVDLGDGDITQSVSVDGQVDQYHSGDYTLTYSVTDASGNTATAQRIVHVEPQPQPDVVAPGDKIVYLTFDDGPGAYTYELLTILYEYNVKATFFVTGANPEYYDQIGLAYRLGHSIGLHSYSHVYESIYASEEAYFEDLDQIQAIVKAQTGQETTLIRFPGGSSNTVSDFNPGIMTSLTDAVTDMGYQYFDWNVLSGDAGETTDPNTIAWNVCSGMIQNNVSVVLQHDIKSYSVEAMEMILAWGIENGYTFLPLTASSPNAHHGVNN